MAWRPVVAPPPGAPPMMMFTEHGGKPAAAPAPAGDPLFSSVQLLVPGDGTNGGTDVHDHSNFASTPVVVGSVTTSTTRVRYGTASVRVPAGATIKYTNQRFKFVGDFTIEADMYFDAAGYTSNRTVFNISESESAGRTVIFLASSTGRLSINTFGGSTSTFGTTSIPLNQWGNVAVTRKGSTLYAFLNGTLLGTTTLSGTMGNGIGGVWAPAPDTTGDTSTVYWANLRVTDAYARYTTTYTPASAQFPEST